MRKMSFLSKSGITKGPLGWYPVARQSIFVNKSSKAAMNNILDRVNKRVELNMREDMPPLIAFPEGTQSNG
jgi:1-acyl-sn-glycerol-3-phosphate acyltransferase